MYFNFGGRVAENYWDRRAFLQSWWRVSARDRRWNPPAYRVLFDALVRRRDPHLRSLQPVPLTIEAVPRRTQSTGLGDMMMPAGMGDSIVAHALVLGDAPAPRDANGLPRSAFLALLAFANDEETLDYLLQAAWLHAQARGARRIVAPCELTPSLSAGLLLDHFHLAPPLHTPYNAPYMPELMAGAMEPLRYSRLWHLVADASLPKSVWPGAFEVVPFDAARLANDLLPLAQAVARGDELLAPPSAAEVAFALRLWAVAPLHGRLALLEGAPVGFYLAQGDVGGSWRRLRGGRPLWARATLAVRQPTAAKTGRVLLGGFHPQVRGRGLAQHLLADAHALAVAQRWHSLAIGPVAEESAAAQWLARSGATARQRYALYVQEG